MNNNKTYLKVYYAINTKIIQIYLSIYLSFIIYLGILSGVPIWFFNLN